MAKSAILRSAIGVPLMLLTIFLPAGSLDYWQGWLFFTVMLICGTLMSLYFLRKDPRLLARRMKLKEERPAQKVIVPLLYGLIAATIVVAATDHRLEWSVDFPLLGVAGDLMVIAGFYLYFLVFRENSFAGSTIEISADQRVISTGPYAIVRHPLYVALSVTALGIPLALGSYWAALLVVPIVALLVWRLLDEEACLVNDLPGYAEYERKVRWRLLPGVF
ncbi:MAG TPA: isoprenylcysteine carboxylmethyltransferase family protein [Candidatus Acidoferrum sp.]|nr:isoprenylcysteine carboxylmethyltransferase family protein [Candidatus Acidoferrum sp.]